MSIQLGSVTLDALVHRRLAELIGDGEWHDIEPVYRDLIKLVPPGVAMREREKYRRTKARTDARKREEKPPEKRRPLTGARKVDPVDAVRYGARNVIRELIGSQGRRRAYEVRVVDGVRQVRRVRLPRQLVTDAALEQQLRPAFNSLADHFHQVGMDYAAEQVQLAAHECGFHLSSCPKGCSLSRITKPAEAALDAEQDG